MMMQRQTRGSVGLLLVLVALVLVAPMSAGTSWAFTDVPDSYAFAPWINWLHSLGIANGYADGSFNPGGNVTRGQMTTFLGKTVLMLQPTKGLQFAIETAVSDPGHLFVFTPADPLAITDPLLPVPETAGYRLEASTDGVNWAPASAVTDGTLGPLMVFDAAGYSTDTYFRAVVIYKADPLVEQPQQAMFTQLSRTPAAMTLSQPPATGAKVHPQVSWTAVPGAVCYVVIIWPSGGTTESDPCYVAIVEGERTSILYGAAGGPGVLLTGTTQEALTAGASYDAEVFAIDGYGGELGYKLKTFATAP